MKLTNKQAVVLASCDLRATAPMKLLRKETGLREHTIRYALRGLESRGVISSIPLVNLHSLGYANYNIFFSIGAERRSSKDALVKALMEAPQVVWIGEFGGEFQYGLGICAHHPCELFDFMHGLSASFQRLFFSKEFSCQCSVTYFSRRYLTSKKFSAEPLTVTSNGKPIEYDDLDARILSALATYGNLPHRQIALKLQMPLSTLELRLKKLEDRGAIKGFIYAVNPSIYGMQQYNLLIYAKGLNTKLSEDLYKFCCNHRHVTLLIESIGTWDFEIIVEVSRSEEATEIVQQLYDEFGSAINNIRPLPKFRDLKTRWFPLVK